MDQMDIQILEAINAVSSKSFVRPKELNLAINLGSTELGDRLKLLKTSGHVEIITSDYVSGETLPNFISKIKLTDLGCQILEKNR